LDSIHARSLCLHRFFSDRDRTADSLFGSHHLDHAPDESTHLAQELNSHLLRYREERDLR
jgi:hypothetical protein